MEMVEELTAGAARRPTGRLRPFIRRYVGSRIEGLEPGEHGGLPSPFLTLIVGIDSAIDVVAMPDRRQAPGSFAAILGGLHTCAATVAYGTSLSCVNVELSPLGARSLLGVRAGELASRVVALEDVLGRRGVELPERLAHAGSWPQRFDVLDMAFAAGLTDRLARSPPLGRAWRRIVSSGGAARIDAWPRRSGGAGATCWIGSGSSSVSAPRWRPVWCASIVPAACWSIQWGPQRRWWPPVAAITTKRT